MGRPVVQEGERKEKVLGKERIVTPPEEKKERVKKGRERKERVRRKMSSRGCKRDSKGGLRNDPKDRTDEAGEAGALRGGALVDAEGVLAIERLLEESATKGLNMRAEVERQFSQGECGLPVSGSEDAGR